MKIINYSEVSRILCGSSKSLNAKRIPEKHQNAITELELLISNWQIKWEKIK